ncbi:MAG: hypothetical protein E6176_05210, partial [Clostridium celatum]|nr:hypothetical protein [Clostridium celatum]
TEQLTKEAQAFGSVDRLSRVLTVLGDAANQMRTAVNQRLVLEIAFTKLARPNTELSLEALADRVAVLEQQLANGVVAVPAGEKPAAPVHASTPASASVAISTSAPTPDVAPTSTPVSTPVAAPAPAATQQPAPELPSQPEPKPTAAPAPVAAAASSQLAPVPKEVDQSDALLVRQWKEVSKVCTSKNAAHAALLVSSTLESDDGSELVITLPKGSSFAMRMLSTPAVSEFVKECVAQVIGPRRIKYVESSLAATAISREKRAVQAAPAPTPVAPVTPVVPSAFESVAQPTPAAAPAQASAPNQASAPVVSTPAAPAPEISYSMPWDEPASGSASVEASNYNQVPYSDDDVAAVLDDSVKDTAPTPQPASASVPETEQVSTPKPDPTSASPEDVAARSALPPELNSVADMLEKVFGPAVSLSVEKKPDTETPADPANK